MTTQIKDATGATVTRMTFDDVVGTGAAPNANVLTTQGNVASGATDVGNPVKIGGLVQDNPSATPGILTNGVRANLLTNPNGMLYMAVGDYNGSPGGDGRSSLYGFSGRTGANLGGAPNPVAVGGFLFNGTTWDRARGDVNGTWVQGSDLSGSVASGNSQRVGAISWTANVGPGIQGDGKKQDIACTTSGELRTSLFAPLSTSIDGVPNNLGARLQGSYGAASSNLQLDIRPYIFNGTTWDRERKPNTSKRVVSSAAAGNPDFLKATAGDLSQFWGVNTVASLRYLQIYNKATAPVLGTDTPVLTYPIPASSVFNQTMPNGGMYFSAGIAYAITTDAAGATGAAAADITSFAIMGA